MNFRWVRMSVVAIALCVAGVAHAQVPSTINYQGFLASNTGAPVNNIAQAMTFSLFAAASGGTALWSETQSVVVTNGVFNVVLGTGTPVGNSPALGSLPFNAQYFLEVKVGAETLGPRQALNTAPYAMRATVANAIDAGAKIGSDNTAPCDAPHAGGLRWNAAAVALEVCDGAAWRSLAVGASTFTVSGTVAGLNGTVVLQNNFGNNLTVSANGGFTFSTPLANGSAYGVTVLTQPAGQICAVTNGAGKISGANVTNAAIVCANSFTVGGTISGLSGTVVLQNNLGNNLSISANGSFTFTTQVAAGSAYGVTVLTQPPIVGQSTGQTCTVANGAGTVAGANVTNVAVTCLNNNVIGGTISGLTGTVVLQNNGANPTPFTGNVFAFFAPLTNGSPYNVTVLTQPANQICTVGNNGAGTFTGANIINIAVTCANIASTIGGAVSGLTGTVVLQNNGGNNLTLSADGPFTFSTALANGNPYSVTVLTQPAGQTCTVSGGAGTVGGANVTNVAVNCATNPFTIGGSVSGLSGTVVLQNNGADNLSLSANGSFTFATGIIATRTYSVTVLTQPAGQTCTVANGSGTVTNANITNVAVTCAANIPLFTVGGTVSGLTDTLSLQNNLGNDLKITANGSFTFSTALATASPYGVTVSIQPAGQTCTVKNGSGTIAGANVTNVAVNCVTNIALFTVGGNVAGLSGTVMLQNNLGDDLKVSANGGFAFATALAGGSAYSVTVLTQPAGQTCTVTSGSGNIAGANVTNVVVTCATNTFTVGGTVSGLTGTVVLQNNGGNNLSVSTNTGFAFTTPIVDGGGYSVTVLTQPAGQTCTVTNGAGTVSGANVTNVAVACAATVVTAGMVFNEVNANITGGCDLVELRVIASGSTQNMTLWERDVAVFNFPTMNVAKNDFIIIHFNSGSATCNPTLSLTETLSITQAPASANPQNFDTAYDWYTADTGLVNTDNVLTIVGATGTIIDAVLLANAPTGAVSVASETQAATVAAAGQWEQVGGGVPAGGFVGDDFRSNAVPNLGTTGTTVAGASIQRQDNSDTNQKGDWFQSPVASTWGVLNPGQSALP